MKRYRVWLLAAVLSLAVAFPAGAWEFLMDGAYTWEWDYRSQGGNSGFFGPYDQDAGSGIGGAGLGLFRPPQWLVRIHGEQRWLCLRSRRGHGTSCTCLPIWKSGSTPRFESGATTTSASGRSSAITIGPPTSNIGVGELVASGHLNSRSSGVQRSFSPGYWNTLWMTAETPWGIVAMGKRKSTFGLGNVLQRRREPFV